MTLPVNAAEIEQSQDQELETAVICETGSYGEQTCTASASGKQKQSQYIRVLGVKTHDMVDTSLDTKGQALVFGIMAIGGLVALRKAKSLI